MLDITQGNVYNSRAVMKYYYLSADKMIQGPYSASEMIVMLQDGTLSSTTLVAAAGDNRWRPASSFAFDAAAAECSTWNKEEVIRRGGNSPRKNVLVGISGLFTWQGRLNRKKFCFMSSAFAALFALMVYSPTWVISSGLTEEILAESSDMQPSLEFIQNLPWYVILYAYFLIISWPVLFFSVLSLLVRRFHDVGLSAIWPFFAYIFLLGSLLLEDMTTYLVLLYSLDVIVVVALLFVCLWPGAKGDNRYGSAQ